MLMRAGQAPPTCFSMDVLPAVNTSLLVPGVKSRGYKGWSTNTPLASGHGTMYFASGVQVAAWSSPGGMRPTLNWRVNVSQLLAKRGVVIQELGAPSTAGFHVVNEIALGKGEPRQLLDEPLA